MTTAPSPTNDLTMMLVIHDAFRRDVRRLGAVLAGAPGGPVGTARAGALVTRWEWLTEQLHHHHRGEDEWLWPALRVESGSDPGVLRLLDAMEREHAELGPLQDGADRALRRFAAAPGPAGAAGAAAACRAFSAAFAAHLDHEEGEAVPLLERRLRPEALRRFEVRQQRALGLRTTVTRFFPWLLDEAPPPRRAHVLGLLPAPLRWAVRRSLPAYERAVAPAWT